jgi:tetratricopeptide (TPR) repeat protein
MNHLDTNHLARRLLALVTCGILAWGSSAPEIACLSVRSLAAQESGKPKDDKPVKPTDKPAGKPASDQPASEEPSVEGSDELLTLDQMELPSAARLLKGPAVDWILLINKKVLPVEPVSPRPGTLEALEAAVKKLSRGPVKKGEDAAARDEEKAARNAVSYLQVALPEGEERDFKLHMKFIKEFIYYEDLILQRVDRLLDEKQIADAFELLVALERRHAGWRGIRQREQRLLFVEAGEKLKQEPEQALVLLEDLLKRNAQFEGLDAAFANILEPLIAAAVERGDYRRARHFLERVRKPLPENAAVTHWTKSLHDDAAAQLQQALAAEQQGSLDRALDHLELAARIWPQLQELGDQARRLGNRYPRLHVGVLQLAQRGGDERRGVLSAGERVRHLAGLPLFEPVGMDGTAVRYQTRYFDEWEPTDLGRSIQFRVKLRREPWESRAALTAEALIAALGARLDPRSPRYDERLASCVSAVAFHSPFELAVEFRRAPLRPESLFAFPPESSPAVAAFSESVANPEPTAAPPLFTEVLRDEQRAVYRRSIPEPSANTEFHVAEVLEHRYPSSETAVQGLLRGEVLLLPRVQGAEVPAFEAHSDFFVQEYALPATHMLQFHPQHPALANRALRRALIYAIDRRKILEEVVLQGPSGRLGRMTSAPFATKSYAYNSLVQPHKADLPVAFSMILAAKKELGGDIPPLRMRCPDDPLLQTVARGLIAQWEKIGLKVTLQPTDGTEATTLSDSGKSADWDILYRVTTLTEPLTELWPFLTFDPHARVASLAPLPNWLRQQLITLDQAGDWKSAEQTLRELHKQLWAEVHLIPLWEISEFLVARKTIRGIPARPMFTYQGIERWRIQPWYAKEIP